jgi:hypothetical protein
LRKNRDIDGICNPSALPKLCEMSNPVRVPHTFHGDAFDALDGLYEKRQMYKLRSGKVDENPESRLRHEFMAFRINRF